VDDALTPDRTRVDPDKLVFFSSPHKGLDEVLEAFAHVRRQRPAARLFIADPGCWTDGQASPPEGVVPLGALPHRAVIRHVREAFCAFHPQAQVAEAFGLVFAEANAVGTPVLAHPLGAAEEVLDEQVSDRTQLLDARDPEAAARRLAQWWENGRPSVASQPQFRLSRVLDGWERLLGVRSGTRPHAPMLEAPAV
jgi:glycosyltransferase involved in cell wall biosynthesis